MRIVLTGGGTGGHIIPNMAVIEGLKGDSGKVPSALLSKNFDILYIGAKDGIEKKLIEKLDIRYEGIHCGKFRRYFSLQNFVDFFKVPLGIIEAYRIIKKFKPDVIFAKGGFVSVPPVLAGWKLKIPVIIHESDVSPGMSNKICFRFADKICLSFEETRAYIQKKFLSKVVLTGEPVRESVLHGDVDSGYKFTGFNKHRPIILVMGGSQGACQINDLVRASLDELLKKFQIVHITGRGNLDIGTHKNGYVQYEYLDEQLKNIYAICEMVVTRGGANSLAEIALLKKKALIIPISFASRGEQVLNARVSVKIFGWSLISGDISREEFINSVNLAYNSNVNFSEKFVNGTKKIVKLILNS